MTQTKNMLIQKKSWINIYITEEGEKWERKTMHKGSSQWLQSYSELWTLFYEIKATVVKHHPPTNKQSPIQFVPVVTLSLFWPSDFHNSLSKYLLQIPLPPFYYWLIPGFLLSWGSMFF